MFCLEVIQHNGTKNRPLKVSFSFGGRSHSVECCASQITTFARFRCIVADRLGVWVESSNYEGRSGRADWESDVGAAFSAGKKANE